MTFTYPEILALEWRCANQTEARSVYERALALGGDCRDRSSTASGSAQHRECTGPGYPDDRVYIVKWREDGEPALPQAAPRWSCLHFPVSIRGEVPLGA